MWGREGGCLSGILIDSTSVIVDWRSLIKPVYKTNTHMNLISSQTRSPSHSWVVPQ